MAAGIKITFEVGQELHQADQSWKLKCVATHPRDTGGSGVHDPDIFVHYKSEGGLELSEFNHVAKPSDMSRYPANRDQVAPKVAQFYRADTFELYFDNANIVQAAIEDIKEDIEYLLLSLDLKEVQGGINVVDFGTIGDA